MRRTACVLMLALLGGCMSADRGGNPPQPGCGGHFGSSTGPASVPGLTGPCGTPVTMAFPYGAAPPSPQVAQQMMAQSVPLNMVAMGGAGAGSGLMQAGYNPAAGDYGIMQAQASGPALPGMPPGGMLSPPGMPPVPGAPGGGMAGMPGMPGAGMPAIPPGMIGGPPTGGAGGVPGGVAAIGALPNTPQGLCFPTTRTQVRFVQPVGMKVYWYTKGPDGKESYSQFPIEVPGRYNFLQAAVYRLKLTNIPGQPGLEVYPTLEVVPANAQTAEFLAHSAVPLSFTDEDFKQIKANNYVVKVVYLPRPEYQDLAFVGPGEIVSTQLEPGANPIEEARRRGSILLVIRMGGIDQQAPNTPPIDQPGPGMMPPPGPMGGAMMPPGAIPPNVMVPFGPKGPIIPPQMPPMMNPPPQFQQPQPGMVPMPPQVPPPATPPSVPGYNFNNPPPPPPPLPAGAGKAGVSG